MVKMVYSSGERRTVPSLPIICCPVFLYSEMSVTRWCLKDDYLSVDETMHVHPVLPSVRSVARCQRDFHPSHRSGMDWDYVAVSREGEKWSTKILRLREMSQVSQFNSIVSAQGKKNLTKTQRTVLSRCYKNMQCGNLSYWKPYSTKKESGCIPWRVSAML